MLRDHRFKFPYAAPSTGVFVGSSPKGRGKEAALCQRDRKSLLANPDKNDSAQEKSGVGSPFLWILSFGEAKESISPAGARTGFKIFVAVATQL